MKTNHLDEKLMEKINSQLLRLEYSLKGLAALFERSCGDPPFEKDELFGIGQALESFSHEISNIEDLINCGYDDD